MLRRVAVAAVCASVTLGVDALPNRFADEIQSLAGSCTAAPISGCDTDTRGKLESGDCVLSDGRRLDALEFVGSAGQIVEILLRPLVPTFTVPQVTLVPMEFDLVEPPLVTGGVGGATIRHRLTSSGRWRIAVSSESIFAAGDYVVHLYCYADDTPTFKITTKRSDDRVEVKSEDDKAAFVVRSPFGISNATIERTTKQWPEKVVIQLRLKGLEELTALSQDLGMGY